MFIIIPVGILTLSLVGIGVIVGRKAGYLRKLTPEAHAVGASFWHDMFPELFAFTANVHFRDQWARWLSEIEKGLRRMRVLFSRFDRWWAGVIIRVRTVREDSMAEETVQSVPASAPKPSVLSSPGFVPIITDHATAEPSVRIVPKKLPVDRDKLKSREQQLIVEIAQDPKNPDLYVLLGEIYAGMKNIPDALESFRTALHLRPDDKHVQERIAALGEK